VVPALAGSNSDVSADHEYDRDHDHGYIVPDMLPGQGYGR